MSIITCSVSFLARSSRTQLSFRTPSFSIRQDSSRRIFSSCSCLKIFPGLLRPLVRGVKKFADLVFGGFQKSGLSLGDPALRILQILELEIVAVNSPGRYMTPPSQSFARFFHVAHLKAVPAVKVWVLQLQRPRKALLTACGLFSFLWSFHFDGWLWSRSKHASPCERNKNMLQFYLQNHFIEVYVCDANVLLNPVFASSPVLPANDPQLITHQIFSCCANVWSNSQPLTNHPLWRYVSLDIRFTHHKSSMACSRNFRRLFASRISIAWKIQLRL